MSQSQNTLSTSALTLTIPFKVVVVHVRQGFTISLRVLPITCCMQTSSYPQPRGKAAIKFALNPVIVDVVLGSNVRPCVLEGNEGLSSSRELCDNMAAPSLNNPLAGDVFRGACTACRAEPLSNQKVSRFYFRLRQH